MSFDLFITKDGEEIENLQIENKDVLVGMLAASMGILPDFPGYECDTNIDVSEHLVFDGVSVLDINEPRCIDFNGMKYAIWLAAGIPYHYSLFVFDDLVFVQGIMDMCDFFDVDFRNYIYDFPFDDKGEIFVIEGYNLIPHLFAVDAIELNDMDKEQEDNEELIVPLRKDDE